MKSKIHKPFSICTWLSGIKSESSIYYPRLVSTSIRIKLFKKSLPVFCFFVFGVMSCVGQNQGISNLWQGGYASWGGIPFGGNDINFFTGSPVITYKNRLMNFNLINANICDSNGNLLFYTNGVWIADSTDNPMLNGLNISPPFDKDTLGLWVPQSCLILPYPNHPGEYYLINSSIDGFSWYYYTNNIKYSKIEMNTNGGLGSVTVKNNVIIADMLNSGNITACKHGNGRDWWITCFKAFSDTTYLVQLTPYGLSSLYIQEFGARRNKWITQTVFSPDGNKFAFVTGSDTNHIFRLEIFDFDRCNGTFSNEKLLYFNDSIGNVRGVAFSSNSQYVYVSTIFKVFQFDILQPNIQSSMIQVAEWDSTYSPNPPFAALLCYMQLAPDGKIYLNTGNSTLTMHVINNPDSSGLACDLVQHAITLPTYSVTIPANHPNYFLGAAPGNPCNNAGLTPGPSPKERGVTASPNPSDGKFILWFPVNKDVGWLEIYDVNGKLILKEPVAQWSQYKHVDISHQPDAIYFCKMRWKDGEGSVKVIKN